MFSSIGVFGIAMVIGYFFMPLFLTRETIRSFLSSNTDYEAEWRDYFLSPLTRFLDQHMHFVTPNVVSVIGFVLVVILSYLFYTEANYLLIFAVALVTGFSDMLDGSLARNTKRVTKIGVVLDVSRDFAMVIVLSYFLIAYKFLPTNLFFWFLIGYIFLGLIRNMELRLSAEGKYSLNEDFKFVLDRLRLFIYIIGILFLLLIPLFESFRDLGETLIISSIVMTWLSVLFHSANVKILQDEKGGV